MRKLVYLIATSAAVLMATSGLAAPQAQQPTDAPASLPGGASSLREIHDSWTVGCALQGQPATKVCSLSQEQLDGRTRQRVLILEIVPIDKSTAKGILLLPFGLDLAKGVSLQVDDAKPGPVRPFRTCQPTGCFVELDVDAAFLADLNKGTTLKINAVADGGKDNPFSLPLKGFAAAHARTLELFGVAPKAGAAPKDRTPK